MNIFEKPKYQEWQLYIDETEEEEYHECYKCHRLIYDIAIVRMLLLSGNEEVWACLECRHEGMKPKGRTKTPELRAIEKPKLKKKAIVRHGYYDERPPWCDCVFCERMTESDKIAMWGPKPATLWQEAQP